MNELDKEKILNLLQDKGKKPAVPDVHYVFCCPGHPSSGVQEMNLIKVVLDFMRMGVPFGISHTESNNIYAVRNACLSGNKRYRKDQKPFDGRYPHYKKIIWVDSDNIITTEQVLRLLSHDVDIVAAWYRMYNSMGELDGNNNAACGLVDISKGYSRIRPYKIQEIPCLQTNEKGLIPVDYSGMGLMIVKAGVFESLSYPWFQSWLIEWKEDIINKETGEVIEKDVEMADIVTDDFGFCMRAKEKGFEVFVDPTVLIPHEKRVGV